MQLLANAAVCFGGVVPELRYRSDMETLAGDKAIPVLENCTAMVRRTQLVLEAARVRLEQSQATLLVMPVR